jgi:hypothetical protein
MQSGTQVRLSLLEAAALLIHALKANSDPEMGHHDCEQTIEEIQKKMNQIHYFNKEVIESAFFAATLAKEQQKFDSSLGISYEAILTEICKRNNLKFDALYNVFERKVRK